MKNKSDKEFNVCNRYLIKFNDRCTSYIHEVRVLEMTKEHIKLAIKNSQDNEYIEWKSYEDITVVESLGTDTSSKDDLPF